MKFKRTMEYKVRFLKNKRCRKERETFLSKEVELEVQELSEKVFPVAFTVHDHATIYEGAEGYNEFTKQNCKGYQLYEEEIRIYNGTLYKPVRFSYGSAISTVFERNPNKVIHFHDNGHFLLHDERYTSESIFLDSCEEEKYAKLQEDCEHYKVFDGKIWKETGEPYYWITGECMLIQYGAFDSNRLPANHFSALDREEVLALVKNEASRESYIEVRMPEMVKLYRPKYFNVRIACQAYYNSKIELPRNFSGRYEAAIDYTKQHMDEIPLGNLEYISLSDVLDEENCSFE